jgi:cytoskeletal protein RodZ
LGKPAEKDRNFADPLPKPELNPLQNPTLGRNMGRWAQVYFTTPPEQREQAVVELLQELETEEQARTERHASREKRARALRTPRNGREESKVQNDSELVLVCPSCEQKNPRHWRYCGMCGAPLEAGHEKEKKPVPLPTFLRLAEQPTSEPSRSDVDDVDWLREKELTQSASGSGRGLKIMMVLVFLALIGVLAWMQKQKMASQHSAELPASVPVVSEKQSEPSAPTAASKPPEATPSVTASQAESAPPKSAPEEATKTPSSAGVRAVVPEARTKEEVRSDAEDQTAVTKSKGNAADAEAATAVATAAKNESSGGPDIGQAEYLRGQQYLSGTSGARNSAEAARWLWKAVTKHNTAALVSLADLYAKGDGVAQNCDQARVLWRAAAAKGNSEAANRLRRPGCD